MMGRQPDFDSRSLMDPGGSANSGSGSVSGISFANPGRFSMRQSYSVSALSSGAGTSSSGLYLNTLGYKISDPLFLFVDVGMVMPIHSTVAGANDVNASGNAVVLPRMGLEYKPNDRLSFNFEWVNVKDAAKACGSRACGPAGFGSSFYGSRFP